MHHQRDPAVERNAFLEYETLRAVDRESSICVVRQQAGEYDSRARCGQAAKWDSQPHECDQQNIGEDQPIRRSGCDRARRRAGRANECKRGCGPIDARVSARRLDCAPVDIACRDAGTKKSCRSNRQNAAAGADIEHTLETPPLCKIGERLKAPARRSMVAGAEGEGGLDLDADVVGAKFAAVMRAVHEKAADAHRLEVGKALRHPVRRRHRLDAQRPRRGVARGNSDKAAQACLVGRSPKMDGHLPAAGAVFERRAGRILAVEAFPEICRQPACGLFVADESCDGGGRIHVQQVCSSQSSAQRLSRQL